MLRTIIHEPLLQFLFGGALLFFVIGGRGDIGADQNYALTISAHEQQQIIDGWQKQWGRPPSDAEFETSLKATIRNHILAREARRLHLDQDDKILERRLVQKLEYLQEALAMQDTPTDAELTRWFLKNQESYALPPTYSFDQIFFDTDQRQSAQKDAEAALQQIQKGADAYEMGDPFPRSELPNTMTPTYIATTFGEGFAQAIMALADGALADRVLEDGVLEDGDWHGPLTSGIGVHLVKIKHRNSRRIPPLDEVRRQVLADYQYVLRQQVMADYYADMRQRYSVTIERKRP